MVNILYGCWIKAVYEQIVYQYKFDLRENWTMCKYWEYEVDICVEKGNIPAKDETACWLWFCRWEFTDSNWQCRCVWDNPISLSINCWP